MNTDQTPQHLSTTSAILATSNQPFGPPNPIPTHEAVPSSTYDLAAPAHFDTSNKSSNSIELQHLSNQRPLDASRRGLTSPIEPPLHAKPLPGNARPRGKTPSSPITPPTPPEVVGDEDELWATANKLAATLIKGECEVMDGSLDSSLIFVSLTSKKLNQTLKSL